VVFIGKEGGAANRRRIGFSETPEDIEEEVGLHKRRSPRHPSRCHPSFLESNDITRRAILTGPWKEEFFSILLSYSSKRSVMGASMISADAEREEKADDGLVAGHMYSILQVRRAGATLGVGGTKLLKLRNPWVGPHGYRSRHVMGCRVSQ